MAEEIKFEDWIKEGEKLFGKDKKNWKFKCPNCGNVQNSHDFKKLKVEDIEGIVYYSCIGRWMKNCKGEIGNKKSPCNYTNGGLFDLSKLKVIKDGKKFSAFEFVKSKARGEKEMKTFDNPKDLKDYLKNKAKKGEVVVLDERATATHPRRINQFNKK